MKILALSVWPVFFLISHILFKKAGISMSSGTYSRLGIHPKYGRPFNILLITSGVIQLVFLASILRSPLFAFNAPNILGVVGLICLIITAISGTLVGIITDNYNKRLHKGAATTSCALLIASQLLYGIYLIRINLYIGLFMMVWGLLILPYQSLPSLFGKKIYARNEFYMFLGTFLTNLILIILYF